MIFGKINKKFLLLVAVLLFIVSLVGGIYLYVQKSSRVFIPKLDKYADTSRWCNYIKDATTLYINCDALLLDINAKENNETCFDLQIISNDKNLEKLKICEPNNSFVYSNEILNFKKLMPVSINLKYKSDKVVNSYTFSEVNLKPIEEDYLYNAINEDIASLVQIDSNITYIKNSVDFCPILEKLPIYITEENKLKYKSFKEKNMASDDIYTEPLQSIEAEDDTIERFFICDSYSNSAILKACNKSYIKNLHLMPKKLDNLNININKISWGNNLDESNLKVLHTLSVIYDGMYQERSLINELFFNFNSVLVNLSQIDNLNEKNLCAIAHVYTELNKNNRPVAQELSLLTDFISSNTDNVTSSLCSTITNNSEIDPSGLYLKILYENRDDNNFIIFERCNNLNQYINNEMD